MVHAINSSCRTCDLPAQVLVFLNYNSIVLFLHLAFIERKKAFRRAVTGSRLRVGS